jgi:hypothetical protein
MRFHAMLPVFFLLCSLLWTACWPGAGSGLVGSCTEMGCSDTLVIDIERRDTEPYVEGSYSFTLSPAGESTLIVDCTLDNQDGPLTCSANSVLIETKINGFGDTFTIRISEAPQSILVTVEFGTQLLGEETLSPEYGIFTPNGVECEPMCFQGSTTIRVSAPQ